MTILLIGIADSVSAQNVNRLQRDKQRTAQEIKKTTKEIAENRRQTRSQLNRLNTLGVEIEDKNASIARIKVQVDSMNRGIKRLGDSIAVLDAKMAKLRGEYASAVRSMQSRQGSMDKLAFIFSAESFKQAYRRMRYLRQFSRWRERRSGEIRAVHEELSARRARLHSMNEAKKSSLVKMNVARRELQGKQKETESLVAELRKQGSTLRSILHQKEKEARALDRELDRIIAEQQRKAEEERIRREKQLAEERARKEREEAAARERELAEAKLEEAKKEKNGGRKNKPTKKSSKKDKKRKEQSKPDASRDMAMVEKPRPEKVESGFETADADRALSGSFESNKGRLLFPVNGRYKIVRRFGRQRHADLPYVQTDNGGIDIEVPSGGSARAIFAGKVSAIFRQPGFNTIVMIRHGKYLTIYANLGDISVKTGDSVKANQTIGRVFSDPEDDNRSVLHFEIRREKTKLNPEQWIR